MLMSRGNWRAGFINQNDTQVETKEINDNKNNVFAKCGFNAILFFFLNKLNRSIFE